VRWLHASFAEEAARIRETGHLSDRDIARATGAGVSTVGAWLRGARSPRGERAERLAELSAIVERLARVMEPSYIPVWLQKPLSALENEKPIDLLAQASGGRWRGSSPRWSRRPSRRACRSMSNTYPPAASRCFGPTAQLTAASQHGEVVEGFYLADSEETAWAEWYRALAEVALPPMRQMPRDLWRFQVDLERVADLSSPKQLARVKLELPVPDRRQWPAFQTVGETLFAEGWAGVLYASAARSESVALCLFRSSERLPGVRALPPPIRYDEPPAPPRGLRA
jgi:transcriptional regulator with XRE-family HTH domain/RES domain-containing protein